MKKLTSLLFCSVLISGCSSPEDMTDENFTIAINEQLAKQCISLKLPYDLKKWPMSVVLAQAPPKAVQPFLDAGLVNEQDTTVEVRTWRGTVKGEEPGKKYDLTELGKQYFDAKQDGFCVGNGKVEKIEFYTQKDTNLYTGLPMTKVSYMRVVENIPEWTKTPSLQEKFPLLKELDVPQQKNEVLVLTSAGWKDIDEIK